MCKDLNCMCYDDHSECAARIRELEAEIVERRMDYGEDCKRLDARIADLEQQLAAAQEREAAYAEYKRKLEAIVMWLERNEPSVFARGLWDAINE